MQKQNANQEEKSMTVKEKIMRIMELALEINPPEIKNIGEKTTAVFVRWSPHCNVLTVEIHLGGWRSMRDADRTFDAYPGRNFGDSMDSIIAELEQIKADLPGGEENADEI